MQRERVQPNGAPIPRRRRRQRRARLTAVVIALSLAVAHQHATAAGAAATPKPLPVLRAGTGTGAMTVPLQGATGTTGKVAVRGSRRAGAPVASTGAAMGAVTHPTVA